MAVERHLNVVDGVHMCASMGDSLKNSALIDFSSVVTDAIDGVRTSSTAFE